MFKSTLYPSAKIRKVTLSCEDTLNQPPHKHIKHLIYSQNDQRKIQIGKNLSNEIKLERLSNEIRSSCSRLDPVDLENLKRQRLQNVLGNLFCYLAVVTGKKLAFIYIQFDFLLFQFMPITSCTTAMHCCVLTEPGSMSFITSLQALDSYCEVPPKPAHLQAEQAKLPQILAAGQVLHPLTILMALH